jgi:hypothetical protein
MIIIATILVIMFAVVLIDVFFDIDNLIKSADNQERLDELENEIRELMRLKHHEQAHK